VYCVGVTAIVHTIFEEAKRVAEEDSTNAIEKEPAVINNGT